jgi:ATP-binding cassette subfamily B protein
VNVLAIGAHPDDVEFQAGGTLARWVREGVHVELAYFTAGEKGARDAAATPVEIARVRMAEIEAAAAAIGADGFITALPGGYDAEVGQRGSRLSAGQRQLISFARAFLAAPAVLVLDEATSLLDIPGERAVQAALRTILAGRTALIIAHRLSTVAIADRVLVIEGGRIAEDGPPGQLLAGRGRFSALHASWRKTLA